MRIKKLFFRERKKILNLAQARERRQTLLALQNDEDFLRRSVEKLAAEETYRKSSKLAAGLCMSMEEYEAVEQSLSALAENIGADMTSDLLGSTGHITLAAPRFDLNRDAQPHQADALSRAVSACSRLFITVVPESGDMLIQLNFLFDLAL